MVNGAKTDVNKVERKTIIYGPQYEDGSGEQFVVTYETNHKTYDGKDCGPRLTIEQFNDYYVFIEGQSIGQFLEAIRKAVEDD